MIVKIVNQSALAGRGEVRKNGGTDDFGLMVAATHGRYVYVGLDANRIFEAYIGSTGIKVYLIGYVDENCGFFDNAIDKTPATAGSWQDVDASGNIPSDAVGVLCLLYNANTSVDYKGGIRKNGSSDEFTYGQCYRTRRYQYQICGVDSNRIFEAKVESTDFKVMLIGYVKSPITLFTNGIDKNLTATATWTDIDVTNETASDADGAIVFIVNTNTAGHLAGDVRKNGSTDNHTAYMKLRQNNGCQAASIGMDAEEIFEGWIESTDVDFYLIGYCKPAAGATYTKTWQTDVLFRKLGITKTAVADAAFKKPDLTKTFALDSAFMRTTEIQKQVDALFKKLDVLKQFGIDVDFLKKDIIKSLAIDARFGAILTHTIQKEMDVLFKKLDITKTFAINTWFGTVGAVTYTKTLSIDAVFRYRLKLPTPLGITMDGQLVIPLKREVWIDN